MKQWLLRDIQRQAEEYYRANPPDKNKPAPLSEKPVATKRDQYGLKSV